MATRKYGLIFAMFGLLWLFAAFYYGGVAWILTWPASNFLVVAAGYLGIGPRVFAKRADGRLSIHALLFLLPFLLYTWSMWHMLRIFSRESSIDQLVDGVWLGRRLLGHELPDSVRRVIDLTAEFVEPPRIRGLPSYLCSPIMDAGVPSWEQLNSIVEWLREECEGDTLIHCAQGHGRTATIAAAFLIASGQCQGVNDAVSHIKTSRPTANLNATQRSFLDAHENRLLSLHTTANSTKQ